MKNKELFYKSVGILQKAYFNNTLEHGNCYACAVGNLIADNCGYKFLEDSKYSNSAIWKRIRSGSHEDYDIYTGAGIKYWDQDNKFNQCATIRIKYEGEESNYLDNTLKQIKATGYSIKELDKIEKAFESTDTFNCKDPDGYLGLCKVLDVLMEIHEFNENDKELPERKEIFNKEKLCVISA